MKKYDREKREWVSEEEYERRKSKREKCKGGREHDFVLVLPDQYRIDGSFGMDVAPRFYEELDTLRKKERQAQAEFDASLDNLGLQRRKHYGSWFGSDSRYYICLGCRKKKWG